MSQILIVDDEANILNALKRELKSCNSDFDVETFTSPAEALDRSKIKAFDLVLSDYKMPEMSGVTFLKAFQEIQPDAARIMLSGQIDLDGLAESINITHIYRFVAKPWSVQELLGAVSQALAYRKVILENRRLAAEYKAKHRGWTKFYANKEYQILLVDDDRSALQTMAEDLRCATHFKLMYAELHHEADWATDLKSHHFNFNVETTLSPLEALEWARQNNYDLVIADHHMPEMDGIRFLESFLKIQPDAACILLSSHADMQTLSSAINNLGIYSFIAKPWNLIQLSATVSQAIAYRNLLLDNQQLAIELKYDIDGLTV